MKYTCYDRIKNIRKNVNQKAMYAMADLYMYLSSYNCMCEKSQFNSLVLSLLMLAPIRSIWIIILKKQICLGTRM